jgi:hypothetical protein
MVSKETLEEAAEKFLNKDGFNFYNHYDTRPSFIAGAKWQQEQDKSKYSEEEVLKFTQTILMQYKFGNTDIEQMDLLKETFQLFKKQIRL